jgi:hypothetical protein
MNQQVQIGDIFIQKTGNVYKVLKIQNSEQFPEDPYFKVAKLLENGDWLELGGFTLYQAQEGGLSLYKSANFSL